MTEDELDAVPAQFRAERFAERGRLVDKPRLLGHWGQFAVVAIVLVAVATLFLELVPAGRGLSHGPPELPGGSGRA